MKIVSMKNRDFFVINKFAIIFLKKIKKKQNSTDEWYIILLKKDANKTKNNKL